MCLAIPGQIVEIVDEANRLAAVDVAGVRRTVNVGLLDGARTRATGCSSTSASRSRRSTRTRRPRRSRLLEEMGAEYEQELEELKASVIE